MNNKKITILIIELVLGVLFLLAAYLKAKDPNLFMAQIYGYGVITDPAQLRMVAIFATSIEAALGLALLMGLRLGRFVHVGTQLMLLFYTLLIAYAWVVNGLEDCGCFGDVKIPPQMGILKNIIMMAVLAFAMYLHKPQEDSTTLFFKFRYYKLALSLALGLVTAFVIVPQLSKNEKKPDPVTAQTPDQPENPDVPDPTPTKPTPEPRFANITGTDPITGEEFDLAQGEYIVAMLNMECDHCMDAVPTLNDIAFDPNLPKVVAICWEPAEGKMDEFKAMTGPQFAMHNLGNDFLNFTQYIGGAPPRISILRDGHELFFWDKEAPSLDEVYLKMDELSVQSVQEETPLATESATN